MCMYIEFIRRNVLLEGKRRFVGKIVCDRQNRLERRRGSLTWWIWLATKRKRRSNDGREETGEREQRLEKKVRWLSIA